MSTDTVKTPEELDKEKEQQQTRTTDVNKQDDRQKTPFDEYVASLSDKYVAKCKEQAQKTFFEVAVRNPDGSETIKKYTRKHLTQGQLDEIEDLRITAQDLTEKERGSKKQREANTRWYAKIASCILYDNIRKEFMSEDDFKNAVNRDLKPILDGCIMGEMSGVPN